MYLETYKHGLNVHPQNFCRKAGAGPLHPLELVVPTVPISGRVAGLPRQDGQMGSGPHSACPRPPRISFAALQSGSLPLPAHWLNGEGLTRWPLIRGSAYSFRIDVATRSRSSTFNYSAGSSPAGRRQMTDQKMNFLGTMVWS